MKLLFQQQTIEFEHTPSVEEMIEKINDLLQDRFYFSHLVADGEEILEEPEQYLEQQLANIVSLEIIAIEAKEFINDLLLSAEEYVERSIPHLITLVDMFYNNPSRESWLELGELFEGIQWLSSMIVTVDQSVARPSNWDAVVAPATELQGELGNLEEALENTDTVLLADMLQYEILPVFEIFSLEIKTAIDTEGKRHDLS
jgi:hypothetical protein